MDGGREGGREGKGGREGGREKETEKRGHKIIPKIFAGQAKKFLRTQNFAPSCNSQDNEDNFLFNL